MAYNGISPYLYKNSVSTVDTFDDISGGFNGVTTTFNITVGGASYTRLTAKACLIVLGGIVQEAGVDYTVNAGQITFTTAPVAGLTFEGRHLFGLNAVDTPTSGSVSPSSLSNGGPSWDTSGNLTVSGDLNVTGSLNSGTQGLFWGDNEIANFGDSNDLKIYHSGSHSYIKHVGEGNLYTDIGTGDTYGITTAESETLAEFVSDGKVKLFYNGTLKLETTFNGIDINSPSLTNRALNVAGGGGINVVDENGSIYFGTTSGGYGPNGAIGRAQVNGYHASGSIAGDLVIGAEYQNNIIFGTSNNLTGGLTGRVTVTSTGNFEPVTDNTINLGSSSKRWANIYSADLQLSNEGSANDVDGTWGQYTIQEGENDLFLINRRNGKKYKFVLQEVN